MLGREKVGEATDMVVNGNLVYSTWMEGGLRWTPKFGQVAKRESRS